MKFKRTLAILLCVLMLALPALTACNNEETGTSSEAASAVSGTVSTGKYEADLPEFEWTDKKTFTVCVYSNSVNTTYYSEDVAYDVYDTTDEKLTEAVRRRNLEIEEQYGIEIKGEAVDDVLTSVKEDVTSGTGLYDAAMPFLPACASLAQEDSLCNLYDYTDYLHLDQPWWDQSAEKELTVDGKLFFTVGDITIMQKIVSIAMTFNKKMLSDYFPETDLYEMVEKKEWTFDKLVEMSKTVTSDSDGVAGYSAKDTWGLSSSYADTKMFYLASGERFITKNEDDIPEMAITKTESSINVAQKVLETLQLADTWCIHAQDMKNDYTDIWVGSLAVFGENRSLFRTSAFSAIKKLRAYDDAEEFGLVPMPLFSDTQDTYYTPCSAAYAYGTVIPVSATDPEFSAYMLELMAVGAKNYITNAYYESILKQRDLKDEESEKMLDEYIFSNVVYDLGIVYNFGAVSSTLDSMMGAKSTDVISTFQGIEGTIQSKIDETIEAYN